MSSIFQAATLIVYKVPNETTESVQKVLGELWQQDENIRDDFQITRAEGQGSVHIALPLTVHEADHDAWNHLEYLKLKLRERGIDCHWATSLTGDRSRALAYVISLIDPEAAKHGFRPSKKQRRGRFGETYDRLYDDDPRMSEVDFRVKVINTALRKIGIRNVEKDWAHRKHEYQPGQYRGNITLDSPVDVDLCLKTPYHDAIEIEGSQFRLDFTNIFGLITPTTCTTIGLAVVGDNCEIEEHELQVQEHLSEYNVANNCDATIDNIRISDQYSKYLLCDPCDIMTAQGLCENPMPNGRFFRQIFFANAAPANYTPEYGKAYDSKADQAHTARCISSGGLQPVHSDSLVPVTVEITAKDWTKPSELDELRQKRLCLVYKYHLRLQKGDPIHGSRIIKRIHDWNVEISDKTPRGIEYEYDFLGVEDRYQEDSDALETQIMIHNSLEDQGKDYEWAKGRLEVVSRILNRYQLARDVSEAMSNVVRSKSANTSPSYFTTGINADGTVMDQQEMRQEVQKQRVLKLEEAEANLARLKAELEEAKASDPAYEHPVSTVGIDTPSTPNSFGIESVIPKTPPNTYTVVSPVGRPDPGKAGIKLREVKPVTMAPTPFVFKGKFEGVPIAAPSAPRQALAMTRTAGPGPGPSSAQINNLKLTIHGVEQGLRAFVHAPVGLPCPPRDDLERRLNDLRRQLGEWTNPSESDGMHLAPSHITSGSGRTGSTPFPPSLASTSSVDIDMKPRIQVAETKPVVMGGNRWANLGPSPIINGVDPRLRAMEPRLRKGEIPAEDVKRWKVSHAASEHL